MILVTTHETADFDCAAGVLAALLLHPGAIASFPGAKSSAVKAYLGRERDLLREVRPRDVDLAMVSTLVLVDTLSRERIGPFKVLLDPPGRIPVVGYDHHPAGDDPPGATVHRRATGAVSTLMAGLLREREIRLSAQQATFLALGIFEDTGGFTHAGTTAEDLRAAAWLADQGADLSRVARTLARGLTADQVDLYHALLHEARPYRIRGQNVVMAAIATASFVPDASVVVQQYIEASGIERMAALVRMEDRIILIVRSRSKDLDASRVAAAFGGGGHPSAASAVIREKTLLESRDDLLRVLRDTLVPSVRAADLATPILYTVPADATVADAVRLLNRYRVNALPVIEQGKVVGALTRQVADAAMHHGLSDRPVVDLVAAEIEVVPPEADIDTVQRRLLSRNLRFILVGDGPRRITGIVTRTALLRHLYEKQAAQPGAAVVEAEEEEAEGGEDLTPMMEKHLPSEALKALRLVEELCAVHRVRSYLVGGVVRDLLLGQVNRDLDLVVEGDACRLARDLAGRLGGKLRVHEAFQTAALFVGEGLRIDLATARTEHYPRPAALPEVAPGGLRQDLFRRDFTVNTLAVRLTSPGFGRLLDFFGGRRDLHDGKIRVLHGLSFIEDPTRAFRAVRFAARLDFEISRESAHLIQVARREGVFDRLSPLRLRREVEQLLGERRLGASVRMLAAFHLLPVLHPALRPSRRTYARLERAEEVLGWYRLLYRGEGPQSWAVVLGVLSEGLDEPARHELVKRLRPGKLPASILLDAPGDGRRISARLAGRRPVPASAIHEACRGEPTETLLWLMIMTAREEVRKAVALYLSRLRDVKADIRGTDLLRAGIAQGPQVARGLAAALGAKLDGTAETKESQLAAALAAVGGRQTGS